MPSSTRPTVTDGRLNKKTAGVPARSRRDYPAEHAHFPLNAADTPARLNGVRRTKHQMRAVVQRVREASVAVNGATIGAIDQGLLVFVGVDVDDDEQDAVQMAGKVAGLRCFQDEAGKFNLSVQEVGGGVLVISQFTLHGDCRKGRRPSFTQAARPEQAIPLYETVIRELRAHGLVVAEGSFGAYMEVRLINDGPVTLLLDTKKVF